MNPTTHRFRALTQILLSLAHRMKRPKGRREAARRRRQLARGIIR